ncbi:MAG: response regulator [Deltaproteobacteria bacterium]|nr:response regulator [Deltaproteobacteria bacterium]
MDHRGTVHGRVLVVDDMAANRFLYRAVLEDDGHEVTEAPDGASALSQVDAAERAGRPVELVLLDVSMPGMDGMAVLERLRARPDGGPVVLVLTAAARGPEAIERGLSLGADAYLTKPVDNRELGARVRGALQLHHLKAELAALRRDQTAMLVHDLRHPLANLAMLAEVLETDDGGRDEHLKFAATIRRTVADMTRLVDTILTASRLEAGVFAVDPRPEPLAALVEPTLELFLPLAARRRLSLTASLPPQPVRVLADARTLRQVLDNLVANALKFTPRGGRVTVSAQAEPSRVVVRVRDTGPGVPEAERTMIFDRYRQGVEGRARGGAGLGLAIARGIVEAHGGTIWYEPDPGGAAFAFTLQRA